MDNPTTAGIIYDKALSPGLWEKRLVAGIYNYFEIGSPKENVMRFSLRMPQISLIAMKFKFLG